MSIHRTLFDPCTPARTPTGYVWRELKRYGIERDLKYTPDGSHKSKAYAVTLLNGKRYEIPSEDLAKLNDA